jgi:phage terminase large subunit
MKYRWDYMGEAIGAGIVPFTNLTFREITDDEIRAFDNIRQGLDWGYGADPLAFLRMHYDKTRRRLYLLDEYYAVKTSNRAISDWLKAKGYTDTWIIADSAEPKSIDELRQNGIAKIRGAKKGPGSIEHGEKWLDDLDEIVIDARRTPNAAKEYENIDYKTDADGNVRNELEDKDNHTIDCTRYGCEEDMRGSRTAKAVGSIM